MIFRTLIAVVVLAPPPFASVPAWSWSLIASIVGILLIAWAARLVTEPNRVMPVLCPCPS